ncbi:Tn3 family transposase [Bacillus pacificus]|nr:Tn3 family transposase [Bacillus pacificus]MDW3038030.1 Tn3 family transposase [Bacillus pacificus]TNP02358.1 Tn3 family transposase [Bacillus pacificus]
MKFPVLSNIHLFNKSIIIIFLSYIREYFVLLHYNKKRKRKTSNFLTNILVFLQFCHFVNVFIALPFNIFFGKHSELRERALQDQLPRSSTRNLLINEISMWNTVYLSEAIKALKKKEHFVSATPHPLT